MMSRRRVIPVLLVLVGCVPVTSVAEDVHLSFWKFLRGSWSYEISPTGVKGKCTWKLASRGRALTGRFVESDGTVSTEVSGWQADQKTMVVNGFGSKGNYWHMGFDKVTPSLIEGPCHGMLPDGRAYKGTFTGKRVNDNHYQFAINAKTKDGEDLALEGNFARQENVGATKGPQAVPAVGNKKTLQSTRDDFKEYCDTVRGRWIGDVIWVTDWPGLGKKGDELTSYREWKVTEDGNAMTLKWYEGPGSGTGLAEYDTAARQIRLVGVSSGGTVWNIIVYKEGGKWRWKVDGSYPDGKKVSGVLTINISADGNTHRPTGLMTIGGKKADPLRDVWRRVSK